jgi:ABC-type branched-subunit amino acid transport system substrate-binding protein
VCLVGALVLDSACSTEFDPLTCSSDAQCGTGKACLPATAGGPSYCATVKACTADNDCASNLACVPHGNGNICGSGADFPITVGQSAPQTGPSKDLGLEMNRGVQLAFNEANANGGIRGRTVNIDFIDDQYTPALAEQNARKLVDVQVGPGAPKCPTTMTPPAAGDPFSQTALLPGPKAVLAVIGSVGTPTMVRSAPVVVETGRLYFGAFTGAAAMLRDDKAGPCKKYIFNVRASYGQEARATLEYFFKLGVPDDAHLVSFDQNDAFGDAGYNGLVAAYNAIKGAAPANLKRFRYTRDDVNSVPAQAAATIDAVKALLATPGNHTVGILMTDTYGPGAGYIKALRDWQYGDQTTLNQADRVRFLFSNVSFVGPNSLAARLKDLGTLNTPKGQPKPYTEDVYVSQVMPNYSTDTSQAVLDYKKALAATGAPPTYTSFEGYVVGRIFVEGLRANRQAFTPDNLVAAFESLATLNIGLGGFIGFSATSHQASKSIWGTAINPDGTFTDKYFWSDGAAIQLVE